MINEFHVSSFSVLQGLNCCIMASVNLECVVIDLCRSCIDNCACMHLKEMSYFVCSAETLTIASPAGLRPVSMLTMLACYQYSHCENKNENRKFVSAVGFISMSAYFHSEYFLYCSP